jgi:hypothetical protein
LEKLIRINLVIESKLGLAMQKTSKRSIFITLYLGFLISCSLYLINFASVDSKSNPSQLKSSDPSIYRSGKRSLHYNEFYGVGGVKNMDLKFKFSSRDSKNESKYVNILFQVMSDYYYNLLKEYFNNSGNLQKILNMYPFQNDQKFDEAHSCAGCYLKTGSPLYMVFVNLAPNQTTVKLSYELEFYASSSSTSPESPDNNPIPIYQTAFYPIVAILITTSILIGIIIIILSISMNRSKKLALEIPKVQYKTESLNITDLVSYCSWCGYKLKRVEKYCTRCGKEIEY